MNTGMKREVMDLENVIFVCFGQTEDDYLPQVANDDNVICDLVQEYTGKPMNWVEAEYHHQTEQWQ